MDNKTQFAGFVLGTILFFSGTTYAASGGGDVSWGIAAIGFFVSIILGSIVPNSSNASQHTHSPPRELENRDDWSATTRRFGPYTEGVEFRTEKPDGTVTYERHIRRWE